MTAPTRQPIALSPSRMADYKQCPLAYRLRVVDRIRTPRDPSAVIGSVVHAALEDLFELPGPLRTLGNARSALGSRWARLGDEMWLFDDVAESRQLAEELLVRYFGMEDPTRVLVARREVRVEAVTQAGTPLRGMIDRVDRSADGRTRVVDYKTGKAPPERYEARAIGSLLTYGLLLMLAPGGHAPSMLRLIYLGSGEVLDYQPTARELTTHHKKVDAVWKAILRSARTGDFRPSPGPLCRWCPFHEQCPAKGGTTPPYPGWPDPIEAP